MNSKTKVAILLAFSAAYFIIDLILLILYASYELNNDIFVIIGSQSSTQTVNNGVAIVVGMTLNLANCAAIFRLGLVMNYVKEESATLRYATGGGHYNEFSSVYQFVISILTIASTITSIIAFAQNCQYASSCYSYYSMLYVILLLNAHLTFLIVGIIVLLIVTNILAFIVLSCWPTDEGIQKNMSKLNEYISGRLKIIFNALYIDTLEIMKSNANDNNNNIVPDRLIDESSPSHSSVITAPVIGYQSTNSGTIAQVTVDVDSKT